MATASGSSDLLTALAALSDHARLRMLRLLAAHELSVGELAQVLQMPQSTASRHLKLLLEAELVARRSDRTAALYRLSTAMRPEVQNLWGAIQPTLSDHEDGDDGPRLAAILAERRIDTRSFFGEVGGEWERVRRELFGTGFGAQALLSLLDPSLVMADLGCGIGNAALLVAPCVKEVIAVDREAAMLDAARRHPVATENITYIEGDVLDIPLKNDSVDVAMFFLVLHHVEEPAAAIAEAARITRSGGRILVVDMQEHDRDEYRHTMGHLHLGFSDTAVESWCKETGISVAQRRSLSPAPGAVGPSLFCAVLDVS